MLGDHMPYNIGNPDEYSIKEAAEIIVKSIGSDSKLTYCDLPKDDPKRRRPVIDRVASLGYGPVVTFEEGLRETAEFFKNFRS